VPASSPAREASAATPYWGSCAAAHATYPRSSGSTTAVASIVGTPSTVGSVAIGGRQASGIGHRASGIHDALLSR
jgi:hypothetical protein